MESFLFMFQVNARDIPRRLNMKLEQVFPIPDVRTARVILAVQPHYDDNDFGAGGTLAGLAEAGVDVYYLTVTNDLVGVIDDQLSPQDATRQLRAEQNESGAAIGVKGHYWLDYPDAGPFDHFEVRRRIIQHIRILRPDFIFTVDPWTPYEAHTDHIHTGLAAAEATILYGFTRLTTDPEVDAGYQPHDIKGIAFYHSWVPNIYFDITHSRERKHRALDAYKAQFALEDFPMVHKSVELKERMHAESCSTPGCTHAEALKVLNPRLLHGVGEAWKYGT
jgi:LmbE family N-acetylglucosaminyl deacetylase